MNHIAGTVDILANPLHPERNDYINKIGLRTLCPPLEQVFSPSNGDVEKVTNQLMSSLKIQEQSKPKSFEECFSSDANGILKCGFCIATYKREGHLRNHLEDKHNLLFALSCSICHNIFPDCTRLTRHKKTCKKIVNTY